MSRGLRVRAGVRVGSALNDAVSRVLRGSGCTPSPPIWSPLGADHPGLWRGGHGSKHTRWTSFLSFQKTVSEDTAHERAEGRGTPKATPCCGRSPTRGSVPRPSDHDLSRSRESDAQATEPPRRAPILPLVALFLRVWEGHCVPGGDVCSRAWSPGHVVKTTFSRYGNACPARPPAWPGSLWSFPGTRPGPETPRGPLLSALASCLHRGSTPRARPASGNHGLPLATRTPAPAPAPERHERARPWVLPPGAPQGGADPKGSSVAGCGCAAGDPSACGCGRASYVLIPLYLPPILPAALGTSRAAELGVCCDL